MLAKLFLELARSEAEAETVKQPATKPLESAHRSTTTRT